MHLPRTFKFLDAPSTLHKDKYPDSDGPSPPFFIALWDTIGDDVTIALRGIWDTSYVRFPFQGPYSSPILFMILILAQCMA